jgi:hypothetical protein
MPRRCDGAYLDGISKPGGNLRRQPTRRATSPPDQNGRVTRPARLRSQRASAHSQRAGPRRPPPPRIAGALVVAGGLLVVVAGFVPWMRISNRGASDSGLDGWGNISGVPTMAGQNINEVISSAGGVGSYRPALFPTVLALFVLVAGVVMLWRRLAPAVWIAAMGAAGAAMFGTYRGLVPGDVAGIVDAVDVHVAAGAWVTAGAGLVACGAAAAALVVRHPGPPVPVPSRGIQPR